MADVATDLRSIFSEFVEGGDSELEKGRFNSAVSEYFKAIAVLCDLKLYEKRAVLSENHTERFKLLRQEYPAAYRLISKIFKDYTDSYNIRLSRMQAEEMKGNVEEIQRVFEDKREGEGINR